MNGIVLLLAAVLVCVVAWLAWSRQEKIVSNRIPSPPKGVALVKLSGGPYQLKWDASDGDDPITYVYSLIGNGVNEADSTMSTSVPVGNLTPGAEYSYELIAENRLGRSEMSEGKVTAPESSSKVVNFLKSIF